MDSIRHTCLKLEVGENVDSKETIFIKGIWFSSHFNLSITDGFNAWICNASMEEVSERAKQWDQPVSEYIETAEKHLGFQHPDSIYRFMDTGDGHKRLSWTFKKEGTILEWRWKFQPSPSNKKTTAKILDFLIDANIGLSEEVVRKTQSLERLKVESEKCLSQSEKFRTEKEEFESSIYAKFVAILNSKKAKLRELRNQLSKGKAAAHESPQEEESIDRSVGDGSEDEEGKKEIKSQGRKRKLSK